MGKIVRLSSLFRVSAAILLNVTLLACSSDENVFGSASISVIGELPDTAVSLVGDWMTDCIQGSSITNTTDTKQLISISGNSYEKSTLTYSNTDDSCSSDETSNLDEASNLRNRRSTLILTNGWVDNNGAPRGAPMSADAMGGSLNVLPTVTKLELGSEPYFFVVDNTDEDVDRLYIPGIGILNSADLYPLQANGDIAFNRQ